MAKTWEASAADIEGVWATPTRTTLSGTTKEYSASVDLITAGYDGVQVDVGVLFDASPTDDVVVRAYGRLDSSWDGQEQSVFTRRVARVASDEIFITFSIYDYAHVRISCEQTGSTDSHDVRARARRFTLT